MKTIIIVLSLFFCTFAYAETDMYVFSDYTPVRIMYLVRGADVELEASKAGLSGAKKKVLPNEIPQTREHRNAWKLKQGTVQADATIVKSIENAKKKKAGDKAAAIAKLKAQGLTDDELLALNIRQEGV